MDKIKKYTLFKRGLEKLYKTYNVLPHNFSGTVVENWHGGEISNVSKTNTESLLLVEEVKKKK